MLSPGGAPRQNMSCRPRNWSRRLTSSRSAGVAERRQGDPRGLGGLDRLADQPPGAARPGVGQVRGRVPGAGRAAALEDPAPGRCPGRPRPRRACRRGRSSRPGRTGSSPGRRPAARPAPRPPASSGTAWPTCAAGRRRPVPWRAGQSTLRCPAAVSGTSPVRCSDVQGLAGQVPGGFRAGSAGTARAARAAGTRRTASGADARGRP